MDITPYLEDLEARIDPAVEEQLLQEWRTFSDGRFGGDIFTPRRAAAAPAGVEWPTFSVNAAQRDYTIMALQQLSECSQKLADASGQLMNVRCNYGTAILPSLFDAELFVMDEELNTLPTNRPLEGGLTAIRELVARGVPHLDAGLWAKVISMAAYFQELFAPYPKIRRYIRIYHADMQGPMDCCELLWGCALYFDVYDNAELVHALLELLTRTYSAAMHDWQAHVPPLDGYEFHWGFLHRGYIMLRDDSAMNFSPAMFDEFIKPYDQRLLDEFGGGAIHFCGRGDHYIASMSSIPSLHSIAMSQPEMNDMERIYQHTVDKGIALIGLQRQAAEAALARGRLLHGRVHCG